MTPQLSKFARSSRSSMPRPARLGDGGWTLVKAWCENNPPRSQAD